MFNFVPQSQHGKARRKLSGTGTQDAEERRVRRFEAKQEKVYSTEFADFVVACRSTRVVNAYKALYEKRNVMGMLRLTDPIIKEFCTAATTKVAQAAGDWEFNHFLESVKTAKVAKATPAVDITFNVGDPSTAQAIRNQTMSMIREITEAQRELIRTMMSEALSQGLGPEDAGRMFRSNIGLTSNQMKAVEKYRSLLEKGSREALGRGLRDRRFDRTIENAINRNVELTKQQIDRMVDRYRERAIMARAETIARTEALEAINITRHQAQMQVMNELQLDERRMERTWRCAMDGRQRDTHGAMNGQVRGMSEPFNSRSGAKLMFPGDPTAPAAERINCRCVTLMRVKEPHEVMQTIIDEGVIAQMPKTVIPKTGLSTSSFVKNPKGNYHIPSTPVDLPPASGYSLDQFPKPPMAEFEAVYTRMSTESLKAAVTEAETTALQNYTAHGHTLINKADIEKQLRSPGSLSGTRLEVAERDIKQIDSAMAKASLSENVTVYRGAASKADFKSWFPDIKVGQQIVVDPSYMSTTLSRGWAETFVQHERKGGITFEILLPKGARVIPLKDISLHPKELEYLIDRGSSFVVRKITSKTITLELLLT